MKKFFPLILVALVLALGGCGAREIQNDNNAVENNKPVITEPAQNQVAGLAVAEVGIKIQYPGDYSFSKSTEPNRGGSFSSYQFMNLNKETETPVLLMDILFLNQESIDKYAKNCAINPWDCQVVEIPSLESYAGQKESLEAKSDYKQFKFQEFNGRPYLTASFKCQGDDCALREYVTFIGDIQVKVIIRMETESQAQEADKLFQDIKIIE